MPYSNLETGPYRSCLFIKWSRLVLPFQAPSSPSVKFGVFICGWRGSPLNQNLKSHWLSASSLKLKTRLAPELFYFLFRRKLRMLMASCCAGSALCPTRGPWSGPSSLIRPDTRESSEIKRRKKKKRNWKEKGKERLVKIVLKFLN
jgi:hypothetical protein